VGAQEAVMVGLAEKLRNLQRDGRRLVARAGERSSSFATARRSTACAAWA